MEVRVRRKIEALAFATVAMGMLGAPAFAAIGASATISSQQLGPSSYKYSMTLTNTGDTPIGTFWFGWIPAYDLLPSHPTDFGSPAGWTGIDAPDAFGTASAQWVNTVTPLQPGNSLSGFSIDTPDAPPVMSGTSLLGLPTTESYVYIGEPETDPGFAFVPSVVTPEPTSLALLLAIPAVAGLRRRR
jgi:hypothetical protein